jgi:phage virion morphogenesis protein
MSDITVQIENAEMHARLQQLGNAVTNLQPAMRSIGQSLKSNIRLCFVDTKSPDGINWKALSPVTIANRRQGSSVPLSDTGVLKNSFTVQAAAQSVVVGTNAPQAALMNFGGKKAQFPHLWGDIPARPFMPTAALPNQWAEDIVDIIEQHLTMH